MWDNALELTNQEELRLLKRTISTKVFHFIVVQHNHYSYIQKTKDFIKTNFPTEAQKTFELEKNNPLDFIPELLEANTGFVFIERGENLFLEKYKNISIGLNQRRDKYSLFPIQIILFLPNGAENLRNLKKLMPDVYSIINPIIQLKKEIETTSSNIKLPEYNTDLYANIIEAEEEIDRIRERLTSLSNEPENLPLFIRLNFNLANAYKSLGNYKKALEVLEILQKNIPFEDNENLSTLNNDLGLVYKELGNFKKAKIYLENSLALDLKNYNESHPNTTIIYSNLGMIYKDLGDLQQAKTYLEKALDNDIKNHGEDHPNTTITYSNLGTIYNDLGDLIKAKINMEKALKNDLIHYGENHPSTARRFSNLGGIFKNLGDLLLAKIFMEKALKSDLKNYGENHPNTSIKFSNLGTIYHDLADFQQARIYLEKAYNISKNIFGIEHPNTKLFYENLQDVLKKIH